MEQHTLTVIGIGPGSKDYMLPAAIEAISSARVLVGSSRALSAYAPLDAECKVIDKDIQGVMQFIREKIVHDDVIVLVSGDPGFYSLLPALKRSFPDTSLHIIPGISSVQFAFARIGEIWQDAVLVSVHGREWDSELMRYKAEKKLALLTDSINRPQTIAARLLAEGWPSEAKAWLCRNLSYETETIQELSLLEVTNISGFDHCVMVVKS